MNASSHAYFFSNFSITEKVALISNCGKISLAKGTTNFLYASLPNLPIILPRNSPD